MSHTKRRFMTIAYTVWTEDGELVDKSPEDQPLTFEVGSGEIISGVEGAIKELKKGDRVQIDVASDEAYGPRDESLVVEIPLSKFPAGDRPEVGNIYAVTLEDGSVDHFRVVEITQDACCADFNHPLAGRDLKFEVEVLDVTEA